ncbi:L,D-transpeptidase-like protein [Orenia metallireducens]|uniref:L,D-transpeptidase catalytic domain n=1 Tax=Orenia metallireducens TaxID=1413210 RepID=A0A285GZ93_9FIRM|nr:L,D-transpeptidase [Orenia metallireducens]PRX26480.1 L,D-transpeptidase-like protein [Orenia metallireducens]SNY28899.1 L,D-transpeptidase catalytic domain [Orenia metallireducens]
MNLKNNLIKILLLLLIIIFFTLLTVIVIDYLFEGRVDNSASITDKSDYDNINQYLKDSKYNNLKGLNKAPKLKNLNKLRTALLLYLEDYNHLPDKLEDLVGEYLINIPVETISNSNRVTNTLDFSGGWYYNSQIMQSELNKIIEKSLQANIKHNSSLDTSFYPIQILIERSKQRLYIIQKEKIIKSYPIAIGGADSPTPTGEFRIKSKYILSSEQEEVYGKYWIGIDLWTKGGGYGIHAATDSKIDITKQSSRGCIRMKKDDLKELYDLVPLRTKLVIK